MVRRDVIFVECFVGFAVYTVHVGSEFSADLSVFAEPSPEPPKSINLS